MSKKIDSSKYKHAVAKANRPEWYTDITINSETSESSQVVKASRKFISFPVASGGGGSVAVLNVSETGGKFGKDLPVFSGHAAPISDLDYSIFDDHLLATGSDDTSVKIWTVPEDGLKTTITEATATLKGHEKKIEAVTFNPSAFNVLASAGGNDVKVWDLTSGQARNSINFPDVVYSASWKSDGSMLTTTSKDKKLRTLDPRSGTFAQQVEAHQGVKASISIWLGNTDQLLTTGFSKQREREFYLWDSRSLDKPLKTNQLDSSTGILIPLYDEDSGMLFLGGKGDTSIRWFEMVHDKSPYFQWEGAPSVNAEQQKGLALLPKLSLNVMKCEVAQVLRLTQNAIIPLHFNVPRKTYSLFHDDLFPDTKWLTPGNSASEWFDGQNNPVPKIPVDPTRRPKNAPKPGASTPASSLQATSNSDSSAGLQSISNLSVGSTSQPNSEAEAAAQAEEAKKEVITKKDLQYKFTGVRTSSYRYIAGKPLHPSTNYDHIKDLSLKMAGECDAITASSLYLAVPLNKPGGQLGIIPLTRVGRQPPKLPAIVNGGEVLDFVFDPFDPSILAVACDDSYVRVWKIPPGGIEEDTTDCFLKLSGHRHRVNLVRFHPTAQNVLITSSTELSEPTIKYWDLTTGKEIISLTGFQDQVFSVDHSYDGSKLAAVSKDKMVRIFDPRSKKLLQEGFSHDGARGARVCWLGKTGKICTVGFDKGSQREIKIFDASDLSKPLSTTTIDVSPGVLVPYYDEDTSVLFLWGRGDSSTSFYEIIDEKPYVFYLTKYDSSSLIIGQSFFPKTSVDVRSAEIAKSYVLCQTHIETVSFTVPRTRLEYFQDDIYPATRDLRQATISSTEWFAGENKETPLLNLRPQGMGLVTEAPIEVKAKKYESRKPNELSPDERDKRVLDNMFSNVRDEAGSGPLKQDLKQGVDETEWDD